MARGIYGQSEGNETRNSSVLFGDRIIENDIAEGDHVAILRRQVAAKNWVQVTATTNRLLAEGHSKDRVDSMLSRAMAGLKF